MVEFRGQLFLRYGVAVLAVALAVALRLVLQPLLGEQAPLLLFTLAVIVSAWFGGLGPGLLATALSASIGSYLFLIPSTTSEAFDPRDRVRLVLFIVIGVLASLLSEP
ncbi:MAG: DUF4118 domain-containing protein [Acidobacteriota bacterium]|nr:DUF4118 domain-containing protein [Acidobacteriota bacterium]